MDHLGSMVAYSGTMSFPESQVRERVAATGLPANRLRVLAEFVDPLKPVPEAVAFAYLDFDLYLSTDPDALRLLHPSTEPGSVLVVRLPLLLVRRRVGVKRFLAERGDGYELLEAPVGVGSFCALRRVHERRA